MIDNGKSLFIKYLNTIINHVYNLTVGRTPFEVKFENIGENGIQASWQEFHASVIGKACNGCNRGSTLT